VKYSTLKPKMLLHVCCANCAVYPLKLLDDSFAVTMLFYNPNIFPREEYLKRLDDVKKLSGISGIPLITAAYDPDKWSIAVKGFENEPEGGKRCRKCFDIRLEKTAASALNNKMDIFATTLSISPHKDSSIINETAVSISGKLGIRYYISDLKKKDGFKKANELSRSYGFYRQDYCGCKYSIRKNI
jgi:predicted adenine nucleotide alpha hydrolase (AANH) superfamily ATPase